MIESISNAIVNTDGCSLLDVNPGISTNRTVYTFVGAPEHVLAGALNAARAAFRLIDMRHHHGERCLLLLGCLSYINSFLPLCTENFMPTYICLYIVMFPVTLLCLN